MNILQMCKVLTRAGYEIDLATYPIGDDKDVPGLNIHRCLGIPGIRSVPIGFSLRKIILDSFLFLTVVSLLLRRRYVAVHAIEEAVFLTLPFTFLGVRMIYDLDSLISHQLEYSGVIRGSIPLGIVRYFERLGLRRSCCAITVCESLTTVVRETSPRTKIFQIEDTPLEESRRAARPERVAELREELSLDGRPIAVYTGNLESYQGVDLLLEAAPHLVERIANAAIILVGGAADQVAATKEWLEERNLSDSVLLVGQRPPAEMPEWMALGDCLVSPRREGENTPLKIYTYMQSCVPIVATNLPTNTQVLDETTAILCEPTPESLGAALAQALGNREGSGRLAKAAHARVEADYSPAAFERKFVEAYDWITKQS